MKNAQQIATRIFYAFPLQLLLLHLRSNFLLLLLWLLLLLTISGGFGSSMGFNYLFLDPEYLGEVSFVGFYLIGLAFGVFLISWNTTTYILSSYRFPFLATLHRPFGKYSLNNFLIPSFFVAYYMTEMVRFQWYNEFASVESIVGYCAGFAAGLSTILVFSVMYFHLTNKDMASMRRQQQRQQQLRISEAITALVVRNRHTERQREQQENPYRNAIRVDLFLNEWLRPRLVRSVRHYNFQALEKVFKQNHLNALIIQSLSIVALILMSALVENPFCRIPAAASTMVLFSVLATGIGALTYWLQEWRTIAIILMLGVADKVIGMGWISHENRVLGLNYAPAPARYDYKSLEKIIDDNYAKDVQSTEQILRNWRNKFPSPPPLVIVCASGGGLRASLWGFTVLRELDKLLGGDLMKHTVLMTGASGGMLGTSYYRELYHQKIQGKKIDLEADEYAENVGKDLANSLTFTLVVNDVFLPWVNRQVNGYTYKQDRGYVFEQQLIENFGGLLSQNLAYYQKPEAQGLIPMMMLTPVIINDARFLVMSPQRVSYMMRPPLNMEGETPFAEIDAVDFGALFTNHDPYNARFASALRMSATYPYVLPSAHLPTDPAVEIMDAGFRDNYGLSSASRFLSVFRDWITRNTRDVIILEIRGSEKTYDIPRGQPKGIGSYFTVFSSITDVDNMQDFHHDNYVSFLKSKFGEDRVHIVRFTYKNNLIERRVPLSLHLTRRERIDVQNAIYQEENQAALKYASRLIKMQPFTTTKIQPIAPTAQDSLPATPEMPADSTNSE